jgi:glyoxylase-like metal-dependent hydrolase (beta-lactamase superfamily II)
MFYSLVFNSFAKLKKKLINNLQQSNIMTEVKVLVEGYFKDLSKTRCCAGATITLVRDEDKNILVDTGNPMDKDKIIRALKKMSLKPENIDLVIITHFHPDHVGCNYLFEKAKFITPGVAFWDDIFDRATETQKLSQNLELIKTPGHSEDSATLLVKTKIGLVACAGDLFWFENDDKTKLMEEDCSDKKLFYINREKILKIADFIVPGHGKMFKVKK